MHRRPPQPRSGARRRQQRPRRTAIPSRLRIFSTTPPPPRLRLLRPARRRRLPRRKIRPLAKPPINPASRILPAPAAAGRARTPSALQASAPGKSRADRDEWHRCGKPRDRRGGGAAQPRRRRLRLKPALTLAQMRPMTQVPMRRRDPAQQELGDTRPGHTRPGGFRDRSRRRDRCTGADAKAKSDPALQATIPAARRMPPRPGRRKRRRAANKLPQPFVPGLAGDPPPPPPPRRQTAPERRCVHQGCRPRAKPNAALAQAGADAAAKSGGAIPGRESYRARTGCQARRCGKVGAALAQTKRRPPPQPPARQRRRRPRSRNAPPAGS